MRHGCAGGALHSLNELGTMKFGTFDVFGTDLTAVQNGQALFGIFGILVTIPGIAASQATIAEATRKAREEFGTQGPGQH